MKNAKKVFEDKIVNDYNIDRSGIETLPIQTCACGDAGESYIVFDFYTIPNNKGKHDLVLCCVCRICLGYIEQIFTDINLPFSIKETPKIAGITIKKVGEKNKHLESDYV